MFHRVETINVKACKSANVELLTELMRDVPAVHVQMIWIFTILSKNIGSQLQL